MYNRVTDYIKKYRMIAGEDNVLVGLSGGPDSVCLLFMLLEMKEEYHLKIGAVHVNHGLRHEGAARDEAFVSSLCSRENIPLRIVREDVRTYAVANHMSVEEGGRNIRKKVLLETADMWKADKIALGHNRDDNAETILYNLCRGTDMTGLGGMAPADGKYIRPLLGERKRDIADWLADRGIEYCIDETNEEDLYTRNRIRRRIIPDMENAINPKAVEHMTRAAEKMREVNAYFQKEIRKYTSQCIQCGKDRKLCLLEKKFRSVPEELKNYVLYEALCLASGKRKNIQDVHVMLLRRLMENDVGKKICLPCEITAYRDYHGLIICRDYLQKNAQETKSHPPFREDYVTGDKIPDSFDENPYTKWFDYDIIKSTVKFRTLRDGDFMTINREGARQKIRRFFINNKIPQYRRDSIWLVADGNEIMWIVGYRQNVRYQITAQTKRALRIEYIGGDY